VLFSSTHLDPNARQKQKAEFDFRASGKEKRYSWDYDEQMDISSLASIDRSERRITHRVRQCRRVLARRCTVNCSPRDAHRPTTFRADCGLKTDPAYFPAKPHQNQTAPAGAGSTPGHDGPFFRVDLAWHRLAPLRYERRDRRRFTMARRSDVRRVTDLAVFPAPFFHPGEYLVFARTTVRQLRLFIVDARGEHEPGRGHFHRCFRWPSFSPDGQR
jgi:hypothetical protein